jgi:hypothetical protein
MGTPFADVINIFLIKATDYGLSTLTDDEKNDYLETVLISAVFKFEPVCRTDISLRGETEFTETLTDTEIDILSELMIVEWIKPKLYTTELYRNMLSTKDFNTFSPANLLKEMRETYNTASKTANELMILYSYRD